MPPDSNGLAPLPSDVSERDKDLMARTLYGEANTLSPRAQAAVAQVIVNRTLADGYPGSIGEVVLQRGQFEPWASRRGELQNLSTDSKAYREARQTVEDVLAGAVPDVSGGATHFYAPRAQAAMGRRAPSWAQGDPLASEGGHVFYAPQGKVDRAATGLPAGMGPATWSTLEGAGVMPLDAGTKTKAPAMPKETAAADDDILALYGVKTTPGKPGQKAVAAPSPQPTASAVTAPAGALSDDALLGLYVKADGSKGEATARKAGSQAMPLQSAEGVVDGNTGELVVGGKPFTDNRTGLWDGFSNFANGALLGAGVPLVSAAAALKEKALHGGDLGDLYSQARSVYGGATDQYRQQNPGTAIATELAGAIPTTVAATMAGGAALGAGGNVLLNAVQGSRIANPLIAAGRFATGSMGEGAGLATRMASRGTAGAAAGAFGGAINTGLTGGEIGGNALTGAVLGAGIGATVPAAGAIAGSTINRLTGTASPDVAALARTAQGLGFPVRAAEVSNSGLLRGADAALSKTPGLGYGGISTAKQAALNRNVASLMGEDATNITPSLMQSVKNRLGQTFDRIEKNTWVRQDDQFAGDLQNVFRDATEALDGNQIGKLQKLFRSIQGKFDPATGEMEGSAYQNLTRKGSAIDLMQQGDDSSLKHFAGRLKTALTGAFERSAPDDLAAELRQARNQYRTMKVIEPLIDDTGGNISPDAFRAAVDKATRDMAYGGGGQLADLARVAQAFGPRGATPTQQASTSKSTLGMLAQAGQLAGGVAGAAMGLNHLVPAAMPLLSGAAVPAAATAGIGLAGGRLASGVLRSNALTNRLIDQSLGTGQPSMVNLLAAAAEGQSYAPAAAAYNRARRPSSTANDNTNRLAEFLAGRQARASGSLP